MKPDPYAPTANELLEAIQRRWPEKVELAFATVRGQKLEAELKSKLKEAREDLVGPAESD